MSPGPDYHAWTHRPKAQGGTDPIEIEANVMPWIRIGQYSHTYTDSTQALLVSHQLWYDPALVNAGPTNDYTWTTASVGGDTTYLVSSRKQGWYMWDALLNVGLNGSIASDKGLIEFWLTDTAANELSPYYEAWDIFDDSVFTSGDQGEGHFMVHASGFLHVASTNRQWRFAVRQSSGGNLDIGVEYITIWRLSEDDGNTWTNLSI